mgnify:CR=1 FL=1
MEAKKLFAVVGTDARQAAAGRVLERAGYAVGGAEQVALADYILLPLPLDAARTPLAELLRAARPGTLALGGMLSAEAKAIAAEAGVELVDYFAREELAVANAVPTAEGALQIAMEELPITLHSARVLILGFGRVGKLTAHRMGALGAKVTVSAQSYEDLAWAAAYGYETDRLEDLAWELGGFDLVVNTIPAPVLDERRLRWVDPGAFLLDLASAPGGIDRAAAQRRNLQVLQAPGLPGRVAPVTAAAAIRDAVYHILWEQEA